MLVLLMEGIYEVRHRDGLRWHNIPTKFHEDLFRHLSTLLLLRQQFERL
jgi:hypothetical protein